MDNNKCTTEKLIQAARHISSHHDGANVTMIQFEDGSGKKFNYQIDGGKVQFIHFTAIAG